VTGRHRHFFIPGAQKAGSTTFAVLADEHPQIHMAQPIIPEPRFFLLDHDDSYEMYASRHFAGGENCPVWGEKSVSYLDRSSAPPRIARLLPEALHVVSLRNPIDRAISQYRYSRRHGRETLGFSEAVRANRIVDLRTVNTSAQPFAYLERGKYIYTVRRWLESFARDQVLIVLLDDLESDPAGTCRRMFSFLGVDPDFLPRGLKDRHNEATDAMDFEVDAATLDHMKRELREPTRELETFLGRDLSIWGLW
jgi:hypothetical protein